MKKGGHNGIDVYITTKMRALIQLNNTNNSIQLLPRPLLFDLDGCFPPPCIYHLLSQACLNMGQAYLCLSLATDSALMMTPQNT